MSPPRPAAAPLPATMDVVYTWVDGNWPGYADLMQRFSPTKLELNPERYRDLHQLLRYSLRSLEQFCPWVRQIVFFTCRPQVPAWLRRDHPKVRIVHHDEVMDPAILPTFSSNTIENHLHRIPGLTPQFLYLNDDFLFGRATGIADFFAADGRIKVMGTLAGEHPSFRIYEARHRLISLGFIEHTPILVDRELLTAAQAAQPAAMAATFAQRFRTDDQVRMDYLYRQYLLAHRRDRAVAEPCWRLLRYHRFHKIMHRPAAERRAFDRLRRLRPKFYCLNDDQRDTPHPAVNALVREFLQELYPQPSSFENNV